MSLFGGVISLSSVATLLFVAFGVLLVGYALGRITIKGVSLGDAGVFIVALVAGALFFGVDETGKQLLFTGAKEATDFSAGLSLIESLGLILFVTSVGYMAGPKFFGNFKKNFKSYVLLAVVIVVTGGLAAAGCIGLGQVLGYGASIKEQDGFVAMIVGLWSGSITSTPAFSAAKDAIGAEYESLVSVGHGISYIFGVVGKVLFVQLVPKLMRANMDEERALLVGQSDKQEKTAKKGFSLDHMGVAGFSLAAILGVLIGSIRIPLTASGLDGTCFALTTTGGCLLASLVLGHFGRIGRLEILPAQSTLKLFRELGLVLFLVGAGIPGGAAFVANFDPMYFVYGVLMTTCPVVVGFLFAKYVLKLSLLNNLGAVAGGMTSTPTLGALIRVAGTEDVAAAYAATYPVSLIGVVLMSQLLTILF